MTAELDEIQGLHVISGLPRSGSNCCHPCCRKTPILMSASPALY